MAAKIIDLENDILISPGKVKSLIDFGAINYSDCTSKVTDTTNVTDVNVTNVTDIFDFSKIKVEIESLDQDQITVKLSGLDISIVNAYRRIAIEEIETMTIENATIQTNTCQQCPDLILNNRLAHIPLISDTVDKYRNAEDCDCTTEYCDKCGVEFQLNVKNVSKHYNRRVNTRDLLPVNESIPVLPAYTDYKADDDDDSIHICDLKPGEEISLSAIARKGIAQTYGKWRPTCRIPLRRGYCIRMDEKKIDGLSEENKIELTKVCCKNVFKYDPATKNVTIIGNAKDNRNCKDRRKCIEFMDSLGQHDAIEIKEKGYYVLTLISNGSFKPEDIFYRTIEKFIAKLKHLYDEIAYS